MVLFNGLRILVPTQGTGYPVGRSVLRSRRTAMEDKEFGAWLDAYGRAWEGKDPQAATDL